MRREISTAPRGRCLNCRHRPRKVVSGPSPSFFLTTRQVWSLQIRAESFDALGNLYFASVYGGLNLSQCANGLFNGCGSVYQLSPPAVSGGSWTLTDLYDFGTNGGANDGLNPYWGVTLSRTGALYGNGERRDATGQCIN